MGQTLQVLNQKRGLPCCYMTLVMMAALTLGCKTPSLLVAAGAPGYFSQLKQLTNQEHSLYLRYTDQPDIYEFVSCDATVGGAAQACDGDDCLPAQIERPPQCVPAFRSAPQSEYCQIYYALKPRCPRIAAFKEYCADSSDATPVPEGFTSRLECQPSFVETIAKGCPVILPDLAGACQASYEQRQGCRAGDQSQCNEFTSSGGTRFPFQVHSSKLAVSPPQQAALQQQIRYENYLILHEDEAKQRFISFGQGSLLVSLFSPRVFETIFKLIPSQLRRDLIKTSVLGRQINVNTGHLITGAGQGLIVSSIERNSSESLIDQQAFMPKVYCGLIARQGDATIPVPTFVENKSEIIKTVSNWAPYFSAGIGTNMVILKATRQSHPVIKVGGIFVAPFVAFLISSQLGDATPSVVEREFEKLLSPDPALDTQSMHQVDVAMDEVLSVFGRSLIFTRKSTHLTVNECCLPERQPDGTYTAKCAPIFSGDEGSLHTSVHRSGARVDDVCAPYWDKALAAE